MLGNHNSKTGFPRLARPPRGQRGGGGGGGVCVGGAQRPVTFLTHFRIPSSTSPSLPLPPPGRPRGQRRVQQPRALAQAPLPQPASPAWPLPRHMGSQAPVGSLSPWRSPSRRRGEAPCGTGWEPWPVHARHSTPSSGAGGRRLPGGLALQSAKAAWPLGDWVKGLLPTSPGPLGGAGR